MSIFVGAVNEIDRRYWKTPTILYEDFLKAHFEFIQKFLSMVECHQATVDQTEQVLDTPPGLCQNIEGILRVVEFFVSYRRPYSFCCPIDDLLNENASFCEKL